MNDSGAPAHEQFEDEDDFQLMEWIVVAREEEPEMAQQAWACLYDRHVRLLLRVVTRRSRDVFGILESPEDVVMIAFQKMYDRAETFKQPEDTVPDEKGKRRWFFAWLCQIANHVIHDAQREHQKLTTRSIGQDHWADIECDDMRGHISADTDRVRQVMAETLNDCEQDILRTTMHHYDPSTGNPPKLPPEDVQRICTEHSITPENMRQIRLRSYQKLKRALEPAQLPR